MNKLTKKINYLVFLLRGKSYSTEHHIWFSLCVVRSKGLVKSRALEKYLFTKYST